MSQPNFSRETLQLAARFALRAKYCRGFWTDDQAERRGVVMPAMASGGESVAKYNEEETQRILQLLTRIASLPVSPITPETLCDYHRGLLEGTATDPGVVPGAFRTSHAKMGSSYGAHPEEAPGMVKALLAWGSDAADDPLPALPLAGAVIRAIVVHTELLEIHPFAEANGRVARAAEMAILLRAGVPASLAHELHNFYNEDRSAYVQKLRETERGDREAFLRYALSGLNARLEKRLLVGSTGRLGRRQLLRAAFTLVELVIVIMLLGILAGVAAPKLLNTGQTAEEVAEQQIVENVQKGIELYYFDQLGSGPAEFPKALDDNAHTNCRAGSPCFDRVLKQGIIDDRWLKVGDHHYLAPSGREYEYNPVTGEFLAIT